MYLCTGDCLFSTISMMMWLCGTWRQERSLVLRMPHLIFVKYVMGLLISGLYWALPGWDWYGIIMVGIVLFCLTVILYRGLVEKRAPLWKVFYIVAALLLFTCIGLRHMVIFQWTVTAAFAGVSGIFLFYTSKTEDRFQNLCEEGVSVFLLLLCLSIRDSVFLMVLPVAALCFWWKYGSFQWKKLRGGKWPFGLRHWGILLALVLGTIAILGTEKLAYSSPEWKEFLSYNSDRSTIMDYYGLKNYEDNQDFYESLGLSPEEVENLQRYSLYLCDDLYSEKMHELAENAQEEYNRQYTGKDRLVMGVKKVREHLLNPFYAPLSWLSCLSVILVLALSLWKDRRQFWLILSSMERSPCSALPWISWEDRGKGLLRDVSAAAYEYAVGGMEHAAGREGRRGTSCR